MTIEKLILITILFLPIAGKMNRSGTENRMEGLRFDYG